MSFSNIKNAVTRKVGREILKAQKHSPTILFAGGVVGVVATAVLASKATLKLEETLEETQKNFKLSRDLMEANNPSYSEKDWQQDQAIIWTRAAGSVVKLYGPTLLVGALSIGALAGSHQILNRRNMALTVAYGALERGFAEYRQRVVEDQGDWKDREYRFGSVEREVIQETETGPQPDVIDVVDDRTKLASPYMRVFDETTSREYKKGWGHDNQIFIQCQQSYANDMLRARGHVFLNEVYDMLGLERSKQGAVVGWVLGGGGDDYIDFGVMRNNTWEAMQFINGNERGVVLDFNVDGLIYDKI